MQELFTNSSDIVVSSRIIYTPSAFAKVTLLHLQEIGSLKSLKHHASKRTGLDSYLFFIVISGAGELEYEGKKWKLYKGDCVFLDCHEPYIHESDLWELKWIHFNGTSLPAIYEKYRSRGGRAIIHAAALKDFLSLHSSLFSIASSTDYIRDMKINVELNQLLTLLMGESWNPEEKVNKKSMAPVKEYLDEYFAKKISLEELSERFFISKYYLTRVFKEQFGMSINSYLLEVRITHAKQLLRFTDEKVESIGLKCGLGAANYFSRTFKVVEGLTPSEYREKW